MRKVFILSASFLFMLQACKKDGALVPDFEENTTFSSFSDTTQITTNTRRGDSVLADQIAIGLVGEYRDSSFGYTKASIHVQPRLNTNALIFSDNLQLVTVDSVVLSLEYGGFYGDTSVIQTFEVSRINQELFDSAKYYSDVIISTESTPLATHQFGTSPNFKSRINQPDNIGNVDTINLDVPQLRINLGKALGEEIISKQGGTELSNSENFVKFFNGLKITPVNNSGLTDNEAAILYFRLTATDTKMTIYYTDDTTKKFVDFPINTLSSRFNTFEHDYTGSAAETASQNQNTNLAYVQAMAGVETTIKFPTLREKLGGKALVNKAELIIPAADGSYSNNVGKAERLIVASRNSDGALQFIPDALTNSDLFGGEYDPEKNEYKFNISRYIQSYLNGSENENGLTLLVSGSAVKAERVVIFNENNSANKIRLNLYYTNTQ